MYFDQDDVAEFKAAQKAGDLRGARILTVKYRFMSAPFSPGSEAKTPEEARAKVDEIAAKGADLVKVWIDAAGRPPSEALARVLRRRAGAGAQARQDHHGARGRARRRPMIVAEGVNVLAHNVRDQEIPDELRRRRSRRATSR